MWLAAAFCPDTNLVHFNHLSCRTAEQRAVSRMLDRVLGMAKHGLPSWCVSMTGSWPRKRLPYEKGACSSRQGERQQRLVDVVARRGVSGPVAAAAAFLRT